MAFQATSGSQREKWVGAFIPAVAILLVTFMYFTFYANPEMKKVETKYQSAVSEAVTPDVVAKLDYDANKLREEQTELRRTISSVDEEVASKSGTFGQLTPTAKHSAVTALCREHGVAILLDQSVREISLPPLRKKSVDTLKSLLPKDSTSFRELTLSADYRTMVKLLNKLPDVPGVIPLSVKLQKSKAADYSNDSSTPSVSWTVGLLM